MKKNLIWILTGVLILILAGLAIYLYQSGKIRPQAEGEAATLALDPASGTFELDETFSVDIKLDTGGAAVEKVEIQSLRFDPQILALQDADEAIEGIQISPKASVLTQVLTNTADQTAGTINLSLSVPTDTLGFNGVETIATVSFKTIKATDQTKVKFDFTAGETNDTNVLSAGADILSAVTDGAYVVSAPPAMPTVNIKANDLDGPIEIDSGASATLSWTGVPDGVICTASGAWSGNKVATGTESTGALTEAKVYTLTCANSTGSNADSVTINIKDKKPLPDVTVRANGQKQITIKKGASLTLTWTSKDAETCVASGSWSGAQPTYGSAALGPINQAKTYTLTCSNETGSVHDRALVYLENEPMPVVPAVDIKANNSDEPITLSYEGQADLTWTSANADSCKASNDWEGDKATSGKESTGKLTESKTYTLICYKGETNAVDSVTVNVTGQPPAQPGPSDGNQVSEEPAVSQENPEIAQLPAVVKPESESTAPTETQTQELYKGGVIKTWALWVFYALIPLSLTAGIVYFYLRSKKKNKKAEDFGDLPPDWPNSAI